MVEERTMLRMGRIDSDNLATLANHESRSKVDELRFLMKERAKVLGVKLKS